jgi:hypothetical protein
LNLELFKIEVSTRSEFTNQRRFSQKISWNQGSSERQDRVAAKIDGFVKSDLPPSPHPSPPKKRGERGLEDEEFRLLRVHQD